MRRRATGTSFRDMLTLALMGFVAIVVLLISHINPKAENTIDQLPPGNISVNIYWPNDWDTDVDLWVKAPEDQPVGYSNKGARVFNLTRDDLGNMGDITELNYENSFSRGIPPGEYIVNLHLYRNVERVYPVPVKVQVTRTKENKIQQLLYKDVELLSEGQELTVFRFTLDDKGLLKRGSINDLQIPLRSKR